MKFFKLALSLRGFDCRVDDYPMTEDISDINEDIGGESRFFESEITERIY